MTDNETTVKLPTLRWDFSVYNFAMIVAAAATFYSLTNARLDASDKRAEKYIPVIEELQRSTAVQTNRDALQDSRVENIIDSVKDLRRVSDDQIIAQSKTNAEVLAQLSAIRETLAWFRATVEASGGKPPPPIPR